MAHRTKFGRTEVGKNRLGQKPGLRENQEMGIQDRDYTRSRSYVDRSGSGGGGGFGGGLTPVVKWLVIANAVVFVARIFTFHDATPADVQKHKSNRPEPSTPRGAPRQRTPSNRSRRSFVDAQEILVQRAVRARISSELHAAQPAGYYVVQEWLSLDGEQGAARPDLAALSRMPLSRHHDDLAHPLQHARPVVVGARHSNRCAVRREFLLFYLRVGPGRPAPHPRRV